MITLILHRLVAASAGFVVLALALSSSGCRPADEIVTYAVPKEIAAQPQATDRMLAAVLPAGDTAWFFKLVGPAADVDARAHEVAQYFASIRPAAAGTVPKWELPQGWSEQPASGMRAATLVVPTSGKPLELSVTSLPWSGTPAEMLSNVNRWRGQMKLPPTDAQGLAESTRTMPAGDATLTVVDLRGQMQAGGMMPPFAGRTVGQGPVATPDTNAAQLPPDHPPIASATPSSAAPAPLKFEVPKGWQTLPATGMRKAAFEIADGDRQALVTVFDFPAVAKMMDPLENLNRWRREVGLEPIEADALESHLKAIDIDGIDAHSMEAIPEAATPAQSQANRATLAAMVRRGELVWFIKLSGDRDLVVAQRDNFQAFLNSLQFTPAAGATNGN